ncbi:MAG: XTP/dITP diphosphatase [Deltaproteobacteria bacterium]|nr:XTP/dITP diphosphatase [Deltaproteobacteria bacterium]
MRDVLTLVIATKNTGKLIEIAALLKNYPVNLKSLSDFGPIPSVEEDGATFDDNAYKKAAFTARVLGLPALADDSGLVVPALGGGPGILSARYGGDSLTDAQRCDLLLQNLRGKNDRQASFSCVISIATPTGVALTYEARCEGLIAESASGINGFGYDPIFYYPPLNKTFAELTSQEKSQISHRGKALKELLAEFDNVLLWLQQQMPVLEKFPCHGSVTC